MKFPRTYLLGDFLDSRWSILLRCGADLSDLFREEFRYPLEYEYNRQRMKAEGLLDQQVEYYLLKLSRRKKKIETFFRKKPRSEELRRLIEEIEDLSDEIHDCVRDKQTDEIHTLFPELEKRWRRLQEHLP